MCVLSIKVSIRKNLETYLMSLIISLKNLYIHALSQKFLFVLSTLFIDSNVSYFD